MTDLERFEIRAETFRRMTGYMAPGKDVPAAMNPSDDYMRERVEEWERWNVAYGTVVAHVLAAADSVLPGGPSESLDRYEVVNGHRRDGTPV